jgi:hypothetical protein
MPRYILIDNASGYIFGDTANLPSTHVIDGETMAAWGDASLTPALAARWLDESEVREFGRSYEAVSRSALASNETGYHVYRADVHGSDAVPVFMDGQDREAIEAVERDCEYVTTLRCDRPDA